MWSVCSGVIWCSALTFLNGYDFSQFNESGKFYFMNMVKIWSIPLTWDFTWDSPFLSRPMIHRYYLVIVSQSSAYSFSVFGFVFIHISINYPDLLFCLQGLILHFQLINFNCKSLHITIVRLSSIHSIIYNFMFNERQITCTRRK